MSDSATVPFSDSTEPPPKKRYTPLALMLSLFSMGLGHIYVGRLKRGWWFALAGATGSLAMVAFLCLPPSPLIACAFVLLFVTTFGLYLYAAVDAARTARRMRTIARGRLRRWPSYMALVVFAVAISMIADHVKARIAWHEFNIPSESMLPTLRPGEIFVAAQGYFTSHEPSRGDLATLVPPAWPGTIWVKRIVGLPGDRVQMRDGRLYLNDAEIPREAGAEADHLVEHGKTGLPYVETMPDGRRFEIIQFGQSSQLDDTPAVTIPPGYYFVLGDNRNNSLDSRIPTLGLVARAALRDKPIFLFWAHDWRRIGQTLD